MTSDKDLLRDLAGRVAYLEASAAAQEQLLTALAVLVPEDRRADLLQLASALQLKALAVGDQTAAEAASLLLQRVLPLLGDLLQSSPKDAVRLIASEGLLYSQTPKEQRAALQSWLATATADEIAQDIAQARKIARAAVAAHRDAPDAAVRPAAKKRKKPGGP